MVIKRIIDNLMEDLIITIKDLIITKDSAIINGRPITTIITKDLIIIVGMMVGMMVVIGILTIHQITIKIKIMTAITIIIGIITIILKTTIFLKVHLHNNNLRKCKFKTTLRGMLFSHLIVKKHLLKC